LTATLNKFRHITVCSPTFSRNPKLIELLRTICENFSVHNSSNVYTADEVLLHANSNLSDALIIGTEFLSRYSIDQLKSVKAIGKFGVGTDNIDIQALKDSNIWFEAITGVNKRSVAELVLGYMLGHVRNIFKSIELMSSGQWIKYGGFELSNKTIGIVGFGNIGTEVARLLQPFECKLLVFDIVEKNFDCSRLNAKQTELNHLVRSSDIVTLHVPGGPSTNLLFNIDILNRMKPNSLLINTSRASVVDFEAASSLVVNRRLGGYACDVFTTEPFESTQFPISEHFYFTPHIGANTQEAIYNMGLAAVQSLIRYLAFSG
jgi:phosphoglycerate dehydrogenase-like enzyme